MKKSTRLLSAPKKTEQAANNEEIPAWAKALTDQVMALNSKINANSESEKTNMRAAVKAKFGMTDIAVNALDGEPLKELFAQCQTSTKPEWRFPPGYQHPISQRNAGVKNG